MPGRGLARSRRAERNVHIRNLHFFNEPADSARRGPDHKQATEFDSKIGVIFWSKKSNKRKTDDGKFANATTQRRQQTQIETVALQNETWTQFLQYELSVWSQGFEFATQNSKRF